MRGYPGQALMAEVAPVEGETRLIAGVPCTYAKGVYAGSRHGITVTAYPLNGAWVVRTECSSTVIVDDLDAARAA